MFERLVIITVKTFVHIFDVLTLPIYLIIDRPWVKNSKSNAIRARQTDPKDPGSPWINVAPTPKHFIDDCETVTEAIEKAIEVNGRQKLSLGYRQVISEEIVYSEGKPITKYVLSDYIWITNSQIEERISNIGKGLLLSGVKSGDNVMIYAETSINWFVCAQSILKIGGTIATLYSTLNDEGIIHGMNETEVSHVFTSQHLLSKLIRLKDQIPKISTIIYFDTNTNKKEESDPNLKLTALSYLEEMGNLSNNNELTYRKPRGDDIAILLYTSGSTGRPKGVKITHKNLLNAIFNYKRTARQLFDRPTTSRTYIAYLPLAHIFELLLQHIFFINGFRIGYSSPFTLTDMGTAIREGDKGDATLLKPTFMVGVPLVLDRIHKGINLKIDKNGSIARKLFDFAIDYKSFWTQRGFNTPIINHIFCKKFRQLLGGELSVLISGGAPLPRDTHKVIKNCFNIQLLEGYGLSETTGNGFVQDVFDEGYDVVGPPLPGLLVKLVNWEEGRYRITDKPNPRGEIVVGSDSNSIGYYKLDDMTKETYYTDEVGRRWFLTGDIGEVCPNGDFKIIDRKKDLIKLKNGEYVSLGKIESELKSSIFVDNICVFGHLYASDLVALIIPNPSSVVSLAQSLKVDYNLCSDLYDNQTIVENITDQIRSHAINAGLNKYETPQKFILCSDEWTPENGLLTAAMKIMRKNITNKYQKQIDMIYENNNNSEF